MIDLWNIELKLMHVILLEAMEAKVLKLKISTGKCVAFFCVEKQKNANLAVFVIPLYIDDDNATTLFECDLYFSSIFPCNDCFLDPSMKTRVFVMWSAEQNVSVNGMWIKSASRRRRGNGETRKNVCAWCDVV